MNNRPIIFTGSSVLAILAGTKTQARRIVKPQPDYRPLPAHHPNTGRCWYDAYEDGSVLYCPHGTDGDRLWVRERLYERAGQWLYEAGDAPVLLAPEHQAASVVWAHHRTRNVCAAMFMPRWASRQGLEVESVHVERLQDISNADICAELGCPVAWPGPGPEPYTRDLRTAFAAAWNARNAKRGPAFTWSSNPWVWAITFKQV